MFWLTKRLFFSHRRLRALMLGMACAFKSPTDLDQANQLFDVWLNGGDKPHPDLRSVVYRYGIVSYLLTIHHCYIFKLHEPHHLQSILLFSPSRTGQLWEWSSMESAVWEIWERDKHTRKSQIDVCSINHSQQDPSWKVCIHVYLSGVWLLVFFNFPLCKCTWQVSKYGQGWKCNQISRLFLCVGIHCW